MDAAVGEVNVDTGRGCLAPVGLVPGWVGVAGEGCFAEGAADDEG